MFTAEKARLIIESTVTNCITEFVKRKLKKKKSKFQILDLIIPKERKIRSVVGGLETSLGTTLWEPLAKSLAKENDFEVIDSNLQAPSNIPSNLNNILQTIIDDRKSDNSRYDGYKSHDTIKDVCQSYLNNPIDKFKNAPRGRGVDIWLVKDNVNYFFDTKTVQPNLGSFTSYMEQILRWYAYYYSRYPSGKAFARIVFPYNPYPGSSFWDNSTGKGQPLDQKSEGWVENEFWDFCSGLDDTYSIITSVFHEIRTSGVLESRLNSIFSECV